MSIAIPLHLLAAVIWVGGMFFAYMALRPAAASVLEPEMRLTLWSRTLSYFFHWVSIAIVVLLASGFWMVFSVLGGMAAIGLHIHLMLALGLLMVLLFLHLFFAPYKKLNKAVDLKDWQAGAKALNQIRLFVLINLCLGLTVVIIASSGRYF